MLDSFDLSMVATSPISMIGSWSLEEIEKLFVHVVLRCGRIVSIFQKPKLRRSCSRLYEHQLGAFASGLSCVGIGGGL